MVGDIRIAIACRAKIENGDGAGVGIDELTDYVMTQKPAATDDQDRSQVERMSIV